MGFREIAMIVVSLILGGILALNVAPSISASGDATKTSMVGSEFESVTSASRMWMANNSTNGDFTGLTAQAMSGNIPNMILVGTGVTSYLTSKVNANVNYTLVPATTTSANDSASVTIKGLNNVTGAEASLKATLINKYGSAAITDTTVGDGILVVKVRG